MFATELTDVLPPSYPAIAPTKISDPYLQFIHRTASFREVLLNHPIHSQIVNPFALQLFMESHVFILWGEMLLLNTLQQRLTNSKIPWQSITDIDAIQLVDDMTRMESDASPELNCNSRQFELYQAAMTEIGANGEPFQAFLEAVQQGMCPNQAVCDVSIPGVIKTAVAITLSVSSLTNHEIVAALLFRQKDITLVMFQQLLKQVESNQQLNYPNLQLYLQNYLYSDVKLHAPLKQILLQKLCGYDSQKWEQAQDAAQLSLKIKRSVWDYFVKRCTETN